MDFTDDSKWPMSVLSTIIPPSSVNSGKRRTNQLESFAKQPPVERQRFQRASG